MRRFMKWSAIVVSVAVAAVLVGIHREALRDQRLRVHDARRRPVRCRSPSSPHLPPAWEGAEVAVLSDLQVGGWLDNEGMARRAVHELSQRRPALVLLAGDFIDHPMEDDRAEAQEDWEPEDFADVREDARRVAEILRPLGRSGIPTFAVLGNHDYAMEERDAPQLPRAAAVVAEELEAIGVVVLDNASQVVPSPGGERDAGGRPLYVVGIGPRWPGLDDIGKALAGVPEEAARVVFMHNPDTFADIPAGAAPLAVAGHTHGGQIRVPGLPDWSWLTFVTEDEVHVDGWIADYGAPGNRLYVNRGVGMSEVPIRINCPPELTIFRLTAGAAEGGIGTAR